VIGLAAPFFAALLPAAPDAQAPVDRAPILLELRFDGRPLDPQAPPDFSCFDYARNRWTSCRVERTPTPGAYTLGGLLPGKYRLHVSIDENPANPRRHPGDYEAQPVFEITADGPERITVDMPRLIHLTRPGDNGRPIEGMLTSCDKQPSFETPRYAWTPRATVEFGWEPLVPDAEYRYRVLARPCGRPGGEREVVNASTGDVAVKLALPPAGEGEQYVFRVEAWKSGRLVGDLYTHDGGAHSWNYRFRVRDESIPRWAYGAVAGAGAVLLAGAYRLVAVPDQSRRRRRALALVGFVVAGLVIGGGGATAYQWMTAREHERARMAHTAREAARQARLREFVAAFATAAPRPDWWERVQTPYKVDNIGDLLAAWQGFPRGGVGERQFFKSAYQGIVDHPDDDHVVATAIMLLDHVAADYPQRLGLAEFGYTRYFGYRARTDNCANCMIGDTTQSLAVSLSRLYSSAGRHDEAIAACRRLLDERAEDVSPYKLAETWNQLAWAHWRGGDRARALEVIREGIARYGGTVRADELRRTLSTFEQG